MKRSLNFRGRPGRHLTPENLTSLLDHYGVQKPTETKGSILSREMDGAGWFYGFYGRDSRQINVGPRSCGGMSMWIAFVGDTHIRNPIYPMQGLWHTKDEAEAAAIKWAQENKEK